MAVELASRAETVMVQEDPVEFTIPVLAVLVERDLVA